MGDTGFRFWTEDKCLQPDLDRVVKQFKNINANDEVATAMANIDAEYAALVAEASLVTV